MNVQAGDVAIIIKGWPNVGRIVYVVRAVADQDYTGYGKLASWSVESLGSDLDTAVGPAIGGHTPDISLRRLSGVTPEMADRLRNTKAQADFDAALADLALILAPFAWTKDASGVDDDSKC